MGLPSLTRRTTTSGRPSTDAKTLRTPWYLNRLAEIAQDEGVIEAGLTLMREVFGTARHRFYRLLDSTGHGEYVRVVQGSKMNLPLADRGVARDLSIRGIREREETRLIQRILKPGMTVIDVGANMGYYALMEARAVGVEGRVYAIEPEPRNYRLLVRNVALNEYGNVFTFPLGISDETGSSRLHISTHSNLHNLVAPIKAGKNLHTIDIEVQRLDDFIQEQEIDPARVDLVRMDVEGWEAKILEGMQGLLRASQQLKLFIEFHPGAIAGIPGHSLERSLRALDEHGFSIRYATGRATDGTRFQIHDLSITAFMGLAVIQESGLFRVFLEKMTAPRFCEGASLDS